jgi:hypothetical protein
MTPDRHEFVSNFLAIPNQVVQLYIREYIPVTFSLIEERDNIWAHLVVDVVSSIFI